MLTNRLGRFFSRMLDGIVVRLDRYGVHPNVVTAAGFVLNLGAAYLLAVGAFRWGAVAILVANVFDLLDGRLARRSGQVTPFGAFIDSTLDRYADFALLFAVGYHYARSGDLVVLIWVALSIVGALMTSYTRARAECIIPSCRVGFFERSERLAVLIAGALLYRMELALMILAVFANWTALQRIVYTYRTLQRAAVAEAEVEATRVAKPRDGNV